MSLLREVEEHARSLEEIRDIMNSMKSLAYMESRRLEHLVDAQRAVTRNIVAAASDVLSFFPQALPDHAPQLTVTIVLGTERGFCGNLNERLVDALPSATESTSDEPSILIAVGRKLHGVLEQHTGQSPDSRWIRGAGVADEATGVLGQIVSELDELQQAHGAINLSTLFFDSTQKISSRRLLPPFHDAGPPLPPAAHPPVLNMSPNELLVELTDQYVFSSLYETIYDSLRSENLHRVGHLTEAVRHLEDRSSDLTRRANALRQEQITEEIEVILLSASSIEEISQRRS
jgi:F-type H+-transporting ATPase subunit gamma